VSRGIIVGRPLFEATVLPKELITMNRVAYVSAIALVAALPLQAQTPKDWKLRIDRSTSASDPDAAGAIQFTQQGSTLHAVTPQAAVFWRPAQTATGNYTLKGNFTLVKPSDHTNYYGLVFGGSGLDGPSQTYLYFLVGQDGSWLIKQRAGDAKTNDIVPKQINAAVKKPDASGSSTNALEVRVLADKVDFVINGTVVHSAPKSGLKTDGLYGIRSNHRLEIKVDNFAVAS
jgi:hypothetical protein